MLSETIKRTRMYSGITQAQMAKSLFLSEAQYNRKENGRAKISLNEARKLAELLDLNEKIVEKFWMADNIYELMKINKELVYDALKVVEMYYDNYESCIELPSKNCSFSNIENNIKVKKKK